MNLDWKPIALCLFMLLFITMFHQLVPNGQNINWKLIAISLFALLLIGAYRQ